MNKRRLSKILAKAGPRQVQELAEEWDLLYCYINLGF